MLSAEEFLDNYVNGTGVPWSPHIDNIYGLINLAMIEFTKLHVKAALEAVRTELEESHVMRNHPLDDDFDFPIRCYPESNIK